jgi:hypothetical protein
MRVELASDRLSYIILRGRWCDIIILNVHAPAESKVDDMKDRIYEELVLIPKVPSENWVRRFQCQSR